MERANQFRSVGISASALDEHARLCRSPLRNIPETLPCATQEHHVKPRACDPETIIACKEHQNFDELSRRDKNTWLNSNLEQ